MNTPDRIPSPFLARPNIEASPLIHTSFDPYPSFFHPNTDELAIDGELPFVPLNEARSATDEAVMPMLTGEEAIGYILTPSFARYCGYLVWYLDLRIIDGDDVAMTVAERLLTQRPDVIEGDASIPTPYLHRMASNTAIDIARKQNKKSDSIATTESYDTLNDYSWGNTTPSFVETGASTASKRAEDGLIISQLMRHVLTSSDKKIITMQADGYSAEEIGEYVDKSTRAVQTRLYHIRKRLRGVAKAIGLDDNDV